MFFTLVASPHHSSPQQLVLHLGSILNSSSTLTTQSFSLNLLGTPNLHTCTFPQLRAMKARIPARAQSENLTFNELGMGYDSPVDIKKGLQGCLRSYFILELCMWLRTCKLDNAYLHYEFMIGGLFLRTILNLCMWIGWVELFYIFFIIYTC